ncbi:MAG: ATP-binding protein [Chloroflexota bacterium]
MSYQLPNYQVDLTDCDTEPIHIPGRIQPHGMLLVLNPDDLSILQLSDNTEVICGKSPQTLLNQPLSSLFSAEKIEQLHNIVHTEFITDNPTYAWNVCFGESGEIYTGVIHRYQDILLLELEPTLAEGHIQQLYQSIKLSTTRIQQTSSFNDFCQAVANEVHRLTGFDRVMVYRFAAEGHGSVIAESKINALEPFLGLNYPASDIPQQARALYLLNWIRHITDVSYQASDIIPTLHPHSGKPTDLSYSTLRSVSPIHVEYLQNMGVQSSMSLSLVHNNQLWGLIVCHHTTPKHVPYEVRSACEVLAQAVSLQLTAKRTQEQHTHRIDSHAVGAQLLERIALSTRWYEGLVDGSPTVLDCIDADGAAVCVGQQITCFGTTPSEEDIHHLVVWLSQQQMDSIAIDSLPKAYPALSHCKDTASGILAVAIAQEVHEYIIWFRGEILQTVYWGGDPTKSVEASADGQRLSPRKSFEAWKEMVHGHSHPWTTEEQAMASDLRDAIIRILVHQTEKLLQVNRDLSRSNEELDAFAYAIAHDLREPLRGIHTYAQFLLEDHSKQLGEDGQSQIHTLLRLSQRMDNLLTSLLYYSRLGYIHSVSKTVSLQHIVQETIDTLSGTIQQHSVDIRIPRPLPSFPCDQTRLGEVFTNLISNAIKYNDKPEKWIEIGYLDVLDSTDDQIDTITCYIRDNGIGIPEKHQQTIFRIFKRLHGRDKYGGGTGVGLAIVKRIIDRHGGNIRVESEPGQGTTFYFTIPRSND